MKTSTSERGQALVIIALALVAILGFAALAVDSGRVFSERRRAQNAADSAAYAAASAAVDGNPWQSAGLDQAGINGYVDASAAQDAAAFMDVMVYNPPVDGPYSVAGPELEPTEYYQVKIRTRVDQIFSQIVYPGGLQLTVEAVAHARPTGPLSKGDAIVALTPHGCQGIKFHGSEGVKVNGGNVKSKSDAKGTPSSCDSIVSLGGAGGDPNVEVKNGKIISSGTQDFHTGTVVADEFKQNVVTPNIPLLNPPDCSHLTNQTYTGGNATLSPGIYPDGIKISGKNTKVTLTKGMYCLDGGTNGGLIVTGGDLSGYGVLIVIREGSVQLGGQGAIRLAAPKTIKDGLGKQWGGMLFFMPYANTGIVHISGGAGTVFYGTIYAPGPASPASQDKCVVEGTSAPYSVNSSIYCYSVKIGGTADVVVDYKQNQNFQMAGSIELSQ
jgi:hypothetical protein